MKKIIVLLSLLMSVVAFVSFIDKSKSAIMATEKNFEDSLEADRMRYVKLIMETIKGKQNRRADSVFKNIKMLKVPAGQLLAIMNYGYSRSLGVSCGHCHNTSDFASEEKMQKEIAREMSAMTNRINTDLLKNIKGLKSETPIVNCTTCHRGNVKPALDLPEKN